MLQTLRKNIISWYPFEKNTKILQIGLNDIITKELKEKKIEVDIIEKEEEINIEKKYDYILIYGYENYNKISEEVFHVLANTGKILIIGENSFGLSNWSKYDKVLELEKNKERNDTIKKIKKILSDKQINEINTFFVFPNYKMPEVIINEKAKIEQSYIEKYCPEIEENELKIFNENKVIKNIVANDPEMMGFFANSYFIEASKKQINTKIKIVCYNNCRKEEYKLITLIEDDKVKKIPDNEKAEKHIEKMKNIIKQVREQGIDILDYEENGTICSKFISDYKTLDEILAQNYNNIDKIIQILKGIEEILLKNSVKYLECKDNVNLFGESKEKISKLHFLEHGFWDMIPKNCFYINDKYVFFDQEWEDKYLPVEFIIYRSIVNSYELVRKIDVNELLEKLGILEYRNYFEQIDGNLREKIINEEIYNEIYRTPMAVDNLINDYKIDEKRIKQLEEDNTKKQKYILDLEEDNGNKQKYIIELEEDNKNKQKYIEALETDRENKQKYILELEYKVKKKGR